MAELRVGIGVDTHRPGEGRPLYLGGVPFPGETGLAGHSDGDVICHALGDALLGASGLGDLGEHFPDTDPAFEGIAGVELLGRVVSLLREHDFLPRSCDLTFIAEGPRIASARGSIQRNLATVLGVAVDRVSVKATRPEGLGLSGEGAGCIAVATVQAPDGG